MELEIFVCDAFTNQQFKGNSAAVVPVSEWLSDDVMQNIARENNLSETAFIKPVGNHHYHIRWFSPLCEVDFCGHATLASSFVLFEYFDAHDTLHFETNQVGSLWVTRESSGRISMDFPNMAPKPLDEPPRALIEGLSIPPRQVLVNEQAYVVVVADEQQVLAMQTDNALLKQLHPRDVVVTARADREGYDMVSRYFWPANGGDEDPVTGSIHSGLAPYWAEQLGKSSLVAYQASQRGGTLYCQVLDERVMIAGDAILYSRGKVYL